MFSCLIAAPGKPNILGADNFINSRVLIGNGRAGMAWMIIDKYQEITLSHLFV